LLTSAVDNADDGILSNVGSMLGKSTDFGSAALRSVLGGGGLSELGGNIGKTSGLSGKAVTTLLGLLAPIVLGVLRKLKHARGLDSFGLSNLLSSQRDNIAAAMPEGMGESFSYREPIREVTEDTQRAPRPVSHTRTTETYSAAPEHRRSSLGWILPLALLAGLIGLIWSWSSRTPVRAGREDTRVTEQAARLKDRTAHVASFEALRAKYDAAMKWAREHGVHISSVTAQDGKLFIRGTAPSAEVANSFREQIRRVNPNMDDVVVDLRVDSALAPSTPSTDSSAKVHEDAISRSKPMAPADDFSVAADTQTYVVQAGDTLGKISKRFFGTSKDYMRIFDANKSQLKDPDILMIGQTLEIPMK
jgi:hypothetical protein